MGMTSAGTGFDNARLTRSEGASIHICMQGLFIEHVLCALEGIVAGKTDLMLSRGVTLPWLMAITEILRRPSD